MHYPHKNKYVRIEADRDKNKWVGNKISKSV